MSSEKFQPIKGMRDFLPREAKKRQWLLNKIIEIFELWGYSPLETPTIESLEIFKGQIGEDEKLFFQFKDRGGRDVILRYDQTVPACRVVARFKNEITFPFKRYQIQTAFRGENPQKGRYREFLQCDADIFGVSSPLADAESIALSLDIYRRLGFKKVKVLINDRSLLKDIPYEALASIDKLRKIGEDGVIRDMIKKGIEKERAKEYLKKVKGLKPNETIKTILKYLEDMGFDKSWYEFDPTIVRSFSYSSGPIWEVVIPGFTAGSVLGGERYDNLIKSISGIDMPATGFGLGFDRTLEAAEQFGLIPDLAESPTVLVAILSADFIPKYLEIIRLLRENKIASELYPNPDAKLDKQLKYANSRKIPFVVIVGQKEIQNGKIKLKDMKTGKEEELTLKEIVQRVLSKK